MACVRHWFLILVVSLQDLSCHKQWQRRSHHQHLKARKLTWRVPARNVRRQMTPMEMLLQEQKKASIDHDFYDFYHPYEALGDYVFLGTTKPPPGASTLKPPEQGFHHLQDPGQNMDLGYYNKAKIEDYRGCNLVCPHLFFKYGPVCAWTKVKYRGWFRQIDQTFGDHWNGSHDVIEIRDFDSICHMLEANCRDYSVAGTPQENWRSMSTMIPNNNYIRRIFRLLHLGFCGEGIDETETVKPWNAGQFEDTFQDKPSHWEVRTDEIMGQVNDIAHFPTRKTTRIVPADADDFQFIGKR